MKRTAPTASVRAADTLLQFDPLVVPLNRTCAAAARSAGADSNAPVIWIPKYTSASFLHAHYGTGADYGCEEGALDFVPRPGEFLAFAPAYARIVLDSVASASAVVVASLVADMHADILRTYAVITGGEASAALKTVACVPSAPCASSVFEQEMQASQMRVAADLLIPRHAAAEPPLLPRTGVEESPPTPPDEYAAAMEESPPAPPDEHAAALERMMGSSPPEERARKRRFFSAGGGPWEGYGGDARAAYWRPLEDNSSEGLSQFFSLWCFIPANPNLVLSDAAAPEFPPCLVTQAVFASRQSAQSALLRGTATAAGIENFMRYNKPRRRESFVVDHMILLANVAAALAEGEDAVTELARRMAALAGGLYRWCSAQEGENLLYHLQMLNAWPAVGTHLIPAPDEMDQLVEECVLEVAARMRRMKLREDDALRVENRGGCIENSVRAARACASAMKKASTYIRAT